MGFAFGSRAHGSVYISNYDCDYGWHRHADTYILDSIADCMERQIENGGVQSNGGLCFIKGVVLMRQLDYVICLLSDASRGV